MVIHRRQGHTEEETFIVTRITGRPIAIHHQHPHIADRIYH